MTGDLSGRPLAVAVGACRAGLTAACVAGFNDVHVDLMKVDTSRFRVRKRTTRSVTVATPGNVASVS